MILRFREGTDFLNINFDAGCYNFGESPERNYIQVSEKGYRDILAELAFNCFDYSEDLGTNDSGDVHSCIKTGLNSMCLDCRHLYLLCSGTHNQVYSGCVWKDAEPESVADFGEKVRKSIEESAT